MTRKGSISIILVLVGLTAALAAAPATALDSSGSVAALSTGYDGDEQASSPQLQYPGSVTALAGGHDGTEQVSSQQSASPRSDIQPLNGVLGEDGVPQPVPVATVSDGEGFDWTDALIGALISSAVLLTAFITARSVARRRRSTAESRA
jgi:hypothetical protein